MFFSPQEPTSSAAFGSFFPPLLLFVNNGDTGHRCLRDAHRMKLRTSAGHEDGQLRL